MNCCTQFFPNLVKLGLHTWIILSACFPKFLRSSGKPWCNISMVKSISIVSSSSASVMTGSPRDGKAPRGWQTWAQPLGWPLSHLVCWVVSEMVWGYHTVITHLMVLTHSMVLLALAAVHRNVKIAQNKHCIKATYGYICVKLEVYTMCSCSSERV